MSASPHRHNISKSTHAHGLQGYRMMQPAPQQILDLFDGEWSSTMPADSGLLTRPGLAALFDDDRVKWAIDRAGGVTGARVLELGPLEGGHSYMLERAGATEVLAVEANARAFLKCLCVKEVLQLRAARFVLGDCIAFMNSDPGGWDMVLASGILYHLQDPLGFLALLPKMAPRVMLWTHYFDESIIRAVPALAHKFGPLERSTVGGFTVELAQQSYKDALQWSGFCGGSAPTSVWLSRDSILGYLQHLGYGTIEVAFEQPQHANGPAFAVYAQRTDPEKIDASQTR